MNFMTMDSGILSSFTANKNVQAKKNVITVKRVNKSHPRERQNMVFIDKWSLFRAYLV